jgi:putative transposase
MLLGVSFLAHPTKNQKKIISQWIGCARFIWNAKCAEDFYLSRFAKKHLPIETYPKANQTYCQYKDRILSPWLSDCPSQILRNSSANWYATYKNFLKGLCNKPKRKKKSDKGSIFLTRELFKFEKCPDGVIRLFIGTKNNNIGYVSIKMHKAFKEPNSIRLSRENGRYKVSFCYDDGFDESNLLNSSEHLKYLRDFSKKELESMTIGIDRGIVRPVQAGKKYFDFTLEQKNKKKKKEKYIKRCQRSLARKEKGSNRRNKIKQKIGKAYKKIANIRKDFCHKTSRLIVNNNQVIILEDLKTSKMSKKPKAKKDKTGKWQKNNRKSKAGLNKSILDKGWYLLECFLKYKAYRAKKALFKISAHYTSQECADCGYTHPNNRKKQQFLCGRCGHSDHADENAVKVIVKRAIKLILHSGTELSKRGVLLDIERGAINKTRGENSNLAHSLEASKKKEKCLIA